MSDRFEAKQLVCMQKEVWARTKKLTANYGGKWTPCEFGFFLESPQKAVMAIVSVATDNSGLKPVRRCLPHQIYLDGVIEQIEKGATLIAVDYVGPGLSEHEYNIEIWRK